ncbi:hypothetical protein [Leeuwenhoekiella sp. CH_XMU1409-2]|uniref:hypothetical protein n=1 Tax=Leeuwenhoekiella sp. CH_XMU1409-2 TaxID=3107768 RepID=UPI00300B9BB6
MNYRRIKRGYQLLAAIGITLSVLALLFIDTVLAHISVNVLVLLAASLCIPFFCFKDHL